MPPASPSPPPYPRFSATPTQHRLALHRIATYVQSTTTSLSARPNAQHLPAAPVRGTVMIFHGLASTPAIMRPTMRYLFAAGFNVYAPPTAGHAYTTDSGLLPYTLTRPHVGGDKARHVILADRALSAYLADISSAAALDAPDRALHARMMRRLHRLLRDRLPPPHFDNVTRALRLLTGLHRPARFEENLAALCESDHHAYESHPLARLADVASLPGPVAIVGYSLGAVQALNLAARACVEKLVLLAPFLGFRDDEAVGSTVDEHWIPLSALAALDLYDIPFPLSTVRAKHVAACSVASQLLRRPEIVRQLRDRVAVFCVVSEADDACSPRLAMEYCRDSIANKHTIVFEYPTSSGLKHGVHPHADNRYSEALLKEMFRFLSAGDVSLEWLLHAKGDPLLPSIEPASLEIDLWLQPG